MRTGYVEMAKASIPKSEWETEFKGMKAEWDHVGTLEDNYEMKGRHTVHQPGGVQPRSPHFDVQLQTVGPPSLGDRIACTKVAIKVAARSAHKKILSPGGSL